MTFGLDQTRANNIIDATHGTASFTARSGTSHLRLMTANGSVSANGTELTSGGSYVAGTGITLPTMASASAGSAASSADASQTNMPAATITGVEEWDGAGTPLRWWVGALTASKTTSSGDTFTIPSGSYTTAMSGT